jgi:outer membrane lipoprotein
MTTHRGFLNEIIETMSTHRRIPINALTTLLAALTLGACTSQVPLLIRQGPLDSPAPAVVREQVGDYAGQTVRWGGVLIATGNQEHLTRLTVLALPLTHDGEPGSGDDSLGRFIAIVPEFLDPKVYAADRLVTVTGTLHGSEIGMVGKYPYRYPVVEAQAWYLWPEPAAASYDYPYYPGWYDPWYWPWYGPWWYGAWYDPWYFPRRYPYRYPNWHPHDHPGMAPGPDGKPGPPVHGHRRPEHRQPRERPNTGAPPRPGHNAGHPRRVPAVGRDHPARSEVGETPGADATFHQERGADFYREQRSVERAVPGPLRMNNRDFDRGPRWLPFRR